MNNENQKRVVTSLDSHSMYEGSSHFSRVMMSAQDNAATPGHASFDEVMRALEVDSVKTKAALDNIFG